MGILSRLDTWPEALAGVVEATRRAPFAWGEHDCCLWAADCVAAMTGRDFAAGFRGAYSDAAGAVEILANWGSLRALAAHCLGEEIAPRLAMRGDVVLAETAGRPSLGICLGESAAFTGADGLEFIDLGDPACLAAWRV